MKQIKKFCFIYNSFYKIINTCISILHVKKNQLTDEKRPKCNKEEFQCKSTFKCIRREFLCDDENDCGDGEDETGCGQCFAFEFKVTLKKYNFPLKSKKQTSEKSLMIK